MISGPWKFNVWISWKNLIWTGMNCKHHFQSWFPWRISNALNSLHTHAMIVECGQSIEQCPQYIMNSLGCFLFKDWKHQTVVCFWLILSQFVPTQSCLCFLVAHSLQHVCHLKDIWFLTLNSVMWILCN